MPLHKKKDSTQTILYIYSLLFQEKTLEIYWKSALRIFLYCLVPVFEEDVFVVVVFGSSGIGLFSFTIAAVNTSIFPVRIPVVSKKSSSTQVECKSDHQVAKDQVYITSNPVFTIVVIPELYAPVAISGYSLSDHVPIIGTALIFLSKM